MDGQFYQEEADTRIVLHILHTLRIGHSNVLVRTCFSDVVIILIYYFTLFETTFTNCEVSVNCGTGNHLGKRLCNALPLFHAVTGCDSYLWIKRSIKTDLFQCPEKVTQ